MLGLSRSKCKVLMKFTKEYKFKHYHIEDIIIDLIKFKTKNISIESKDPTFKSYFVVDFSHKYLDLLDIPQLLHDQTLINAFPTRITYPTVSYRYSPTIGSIVFNYTKVSKSVKSEDINDYPWYCDESPFIDVRYNHVLTGNLEILNDNEIINIFRFGSKFRLVPSLDIEEIKENLKTNICDYIHKISYNLNIHFGYFQEWKTLFYNLINTKINNTNNIYPWTINMYVFF